VGFIDSIKDAIRGDDRKSGDRPPDAGEPVAGTPDAPVGGGAHADRAAVTEDQEGLGTHSGSTGGKHAAPRDEDAASA
jgi:hypothetical protein